MALGYGRIGLKFSFVLHTYSNDDSRTFSMLQRRMSTIFTIKKISEFLVNFLASVRTWITYFYPDSDSTRRIKRKNEVINSKKNKN